MPVAERDGHRIHYRTWGKASATPLLLIMGLGLSSAGWHRLPERLSRRYRVITFDNRGAGLSDRPRGLYRMHDLADDAAAVLRAVGVGARRKGKRSTGGAHVFGISMGGMIAQELTLRHPGLVRSLVLGATFASWWRSRKPPLAVALTLVGVNIVGPRALPHLAPLLISPEFDRKNPDEFRRWLTAVKESQPGAVFSQIGAILRHSTLPRLGEIATPTLVVTGSADRLVPPENSRVLHAAIPGAKFRELRGAGHVFPFEREDETVKLLQAFYKR